ncbi:hypothetical protein [Hainan hebius popei torovirus]|uniref:Uncharacterized protein n=1 Tax=Hainan hebius popei torovirus TaxID=2116385 RepID=A0A2P1GMW9_9NIDO|nr:hypothetical protein [Hainan hebius popei torovirus]AVM87342.1 hypothetical protein [Hainan hebius popei torovirus]
MYLYIVLVCIRLVFSDVIIPPHAMFEHEYGYTVEDAKLCNEFSDKLLVRNISDVFYGFDWRSCNVYNNRKFPVKCGLVNETFNYGISTFNYAEYMYRNVLEWQRIYSRPLNYSFVDKLFFEGYGFPNILNRDYDYGFGLDFKYKFYKNFYRLNTQYKSVNFAIGRLDWSKKNFTLPSGVKLISFCSPYSSPHYVYNQTLVLMGDNRRLALLRGSTWSRQYNCESIVTKAVNFVIVGSNVTLYGVTYNYILFSGRVDGYVGVVPSCIDYFGGDAICDAQINACKEVERCYFVSVGKFKGKGYVEVGHQEFFDVFSDIQDEVDFKVVHNKAVVGKCVNSYYYVSPYKSNSTYNYWVRVDGNVTTRLYEFDSLLSFSRSLVNYNVSLVLYNILVGKYLEKGYKWVNGVLKRSDVLVIQYVQEAYATNPVLMIVVIVFVVVALLSLLFSYCCSRPLHKVEKRLL